MKKNKKIPLSTPKSDTWVYSTIPEQPQERDYLTPDDRHIAAALYYLQRANVLRHVGPDAEIHGCLRNAAMHAEWARRYWTKEYRKKIEDVGKLFK